MTKKYKKKDGNTLEVTDETTTTITRGQLQSNLAQLRAEGNKVDDQIKEVLVQLEALG